MNWEQAATLVGLGLTIAGVANYFVGSYILAEIKLFRGELKVKMDFAACERIRKDCHKLFEERDDTTCGSIEELRSEFEHHTHTGLPDGSKLIR